MKVRNWTKFQHYKDRKPPWIKVHYDLMDDPDWFELSSDAKVFLVHLWLLASQHETDGSLPDSRVIARRLHIDSKTFQALVSECNQWLVLDDSTMLASCKRVAPTETESETESEAETESESLVQRRSPSNVYDPLFERFWFHFPKKQGKRHAGKAWQEAIKRADAETITAGAARLSQEVKAGRSVRYVKMPTTWLNADGWLDEPNEEFNPGRIDFDDPFDERGSDDAGSGGSLDGQADSEFSLPRPRGTESPRRLARPDFLDPNRKG